MMQTEILFEDKDILVCCKPAGIATQTGGFAAMDVVSELKNYLSAKGQADPFVGVIQRLDQPVEGVLVFGKNKKATAALNKQLTHNEIKKEYLAAVFVKTEDKPTDSFWKEKDEYPLHSKTMLTDYLVKDARTNTSYVVEKPVFPANGKADFKARILECHFGGMYLEVDGREVGVQFIGKFNVSNLLAVYGAAVMLGKKPEDVLVVMSTLHSVSGRLEPIQSPEGFTAIVDYAHTPDALENVLNAIHEVLEGKGGEVITVCGAGGNRDKGKRPLMAQEAVKQSDKVIITSDNPRFEEPQDIINDMLAGLNAQQMKKVISIVDRKEAIRTACMLAKKGDVILIAGKGHEDYQEIKGVKHHFDDKEVVRDIFGISQK